MALYAKLWVDVLDDPKLIRAADSVENGGRGAQHLEFLPWLIAFAKRADDGGRLTVGGVPARARNIARSIPGNPVAGVAGCLAELEAIDILVRDGNALKFASWKRRALGSMKPSDSPERVRERVTKHRDKERQQRTLDLGNADGNTPETPQSTGAVTPNETPAEQEQEQLQEQEQQQQGALPAAVVAVPAAPDPEPQPMPSPPPPAKLTPDAAYALGITTAANAAITARWGEQLHPYHYGSSGQLASDLHDAGVELHVAREAIAEACRTSKQPRPPHAINYFREAILQAHRSAEQRAIDRAESARTPLGPTGRTPSSIADVISQSTHLPIHRKPANDDELQRIFGAERIAATRPWTTSDDNRAALASIITEANEYCKEYLNTSWGKVARDNRILELVAEKVGFPKFDEWKRARSNDSPPVTVSQKGDKL